MSQSKEFQEIKEQLLDKIVNAPEEESKLLAERLHDFIVDQQSIIAKQKQQTRFKLVMELGEENMELHAQIKELEFDRNKYKQAYEGLKKSL